MKFSVFQLSRQGGRATNEDRMGYAYTRDACLFVLADGMGGHPQGEVAAQIAIQTAAVKFQNEARPMLPDVGAFLTSVVMVAHEQILRYAAARGMADAPRTTLAVAVVQDGQVRWVHCGDSRVYLVRNSKLLARTRDHSYRELRDAMGTADAVNRNVLFTCLGSPARPMYDVSNAMTLDSGDRVMLCSDGLWDALDDKAIVRVLSHQRVSQAVPTLVDMALRKAGGNSDNVTAVAMQWETPGIPDATEGEAVDTGIDDTFASTIQTDEFETGDNFLDEEAIERSIAEINETIRRTAARKAQG
ncbi:PP2C family protein-serine/threonine phosphatase [Comamonas flocculans]|uniref:Serine/threonine-protein phosphatase n=1 Tax=Comamonas flocculans TaxID=2597701 RepID=A0A5B8RYS9_9BURK|nr:PP2C family serine/threonine-protein phosphatase [Comamonas flocculans]QEA13934.1 serine/threonine-protein phosphatase [Comamonas flocculans]